MMQAGKIFERKTGKKVAGLSLHEINAFAIKGKPRHGKYGRNLVTPRGNIFQNSLVDIDAYFEKELAKVGQKRQ